MLLASYNLKFRRRGLNGTLKAEKIMESASFFCLKEVTYAIFLGGTIKIGRRRRIAKDFF
jgi:hypothetical protein